MSNVRFLELAKDELADTFEAFEYQKKGLGQHFVEEVSNTIAYIKTAPTLWSKSSEHTRRCLVKNFPYSVIYQYANDEVIIVAIATVLKAPRYKMQMILSEQNIGNNNLIPTNLYIR